MEATIDQTWTKQTMEGLGMFFFFFARLRSGLKGFELSKIL